LERLSDTAKDRSLEIANEQLHEKYITLMCDFAPKDVYPYLLQHCNYRLDYCLELCSAKKITDATAYLLERLLSQSVSQYQLHHKLIVARCTYRTGDVSGALDLILAQLDKRVIELQRQILAKVVADGELGQKSSGMPSLTYASLRGYEADAGRQKWSNSKTKSPRQSTLPWLCVNATRSAHGPVLRRIANNCGSNCSMHW
jgi:hypothetical protein